MRYGNFCGVPEKHRTGCLTTAVNKAGSPEAFILRYRDLLDHYRIDPSKTNPRSPHENGEVEQRHHRFKRVVDLTCYDQLLPGVAAC